MRRPPRYLGFEVSSALNVLKLSRSAVPQSVAVRSCGSPLNSIVYSTDNYGTRGRMTHLRQAHRTCVLSDDGSTPVGKRLNACVRAFSQAALMRLRGLNGRVGRKRSNEAQRPKGEHA